MLLGFLVGVITTFVVEILFVGLLMWVSHAGKLRVGAGPIEPSSVSSFGSKRKPDRVSYAGTGQRSQAVMDHAE
jgi:hypothetical protein